MAELSVIVCERCVDLPRAHRTSVRRHCSLCETQVWVRAKNLAHGLPLVCGPCAIEGAWAARQAGELVVVESASVMDGRPPAG